MFSSEQAKHDKKDCCPKVFQFQHQANLWEIHTTVHCPSLTLWVVRAGGHILRNLAEPVSVAAERIDVIADVDARFREKRLHWKIYEMDEIKLIKIPTLLECL